ncbi:MAG: carboxypeptidase-like regulatory domain-containing protein [Halobacteriota archaeon]
MRAKIDKIFLERHSTKLSLAVSLLDDYSKAKPIGWVEVSLKGRKEKPIRNLSSYYLFLDLPDDAYTVQMGSDYYFDEYSGTYLFSWANVPGDDSDRLLRFLVDDLDIDWAENAEIHKSDDGKTIRIFKDENSAEIKIDEEKEKATLKISDGRTHDLKVKSENGKLKLYKLVVNITLKPRPSYPFPPGATLIRGKVHDSAGEVVSGAKVRVKEKGVENETTEKGEFVLYFGPLTEDEIIREEGKRFVMGDSDKTLHLEVEYDSVIETIEFEAEEGEITSVMIK